MRSAAVDQRQHGAAQRLGTADGSVEGGGLGGCGHELDGGEVAPEACYRKRRIHDNYQLVRANDPVSSDKKCETVLR